MRSSHSGASRSDFAEEPRPVLTQTDDARIYLKAEHKLVLCWRQVPKWPEATSLAPTKIPGRLI
jgi:hypothetical protein